MCTYPWRTRTPAPRLLCYPWRGNPWRSPLRHGLPRHGYTHIPMAHLVLVRHGYEFPNLKKKATGHRPCRRVRQLSSCAATWRSSWRCSSHRGDARRCGGASPAWRCFAGAVGPRRRGRAHRSSVLAGMEVLAGVEVLCRLSASSAWRCSPAAGPRWRGGGRHGEVAHRPSWRSKAGTMVLAGRRWREEDGGEGSCCRG